MRTTDHFGCLIGTLFVLAILSPRLAAGQWPGDPTVNLPICTAESEQSVPKLVSDGAGGAILAWRDKRNGADLDIYAQRVRANGAVDPAWPTNGRGLCLAAGDQGDFGIGLVGDGAGGAIVTWNDWRPLAVGIYAQHVLAGGAVDPAWLADGRTVCSGASSKLSIVSDGTGGAIVAWEDGRTGGGNTDIYAQHVLATGVVDPAWPANGRALCTAANRQESPAIATDGAGGALVVWVDYRNGATYDVYSTRVRAAGTLDPAWPSDGRLLCTNASSKYGAQIVADGSGGAVVSWMDHRASDWDIYAQHVLASGAVDLAWPTDARALTTAAGDQADPSMLPDSSHGAIVTWHEGSLGWYDGDICAQRVLAGGAVDPAWPANGRALCTNGAQKGAPRIAGDGTGGAIVSWDDGRSGSTTDIYAQRVLASGAVDPAWPTDGRAVCTAASYQFSPRLIEDGAGGAIIAWYDERSITNRDIYAQRVQANGELGGVVVGVPEAIPSALALDPPFPNPARAGKLSVRFTLADGATTTIELLDVAGRRLEAREVGGLDAGWHTLDFGRGRPLAPGVYLVRLRQGGSARIVRAVVLH